MTQEEKKKSRNKLFYNVAATVVYKFISVAQEKEDPMSGPTEGYNRIQSSVSKLYRLMQGDYDRKQLLKASANVAAQSIRFMIDVTMVGNKDALKDTINTEPDPD